MKRKFFSVLLAVLLLVTVVLPVSAQETVIPGATLRSAYWTDNTLYLFSDIAGMEAPETIEVTLTRNNQVIGYAYPKSMANANATAHYLLLVDRSLSMSECRSQVFAFVKAMTKTQQTDLKFSVASFDGSCEIVDTGLKSIEQVNSALRTITNNRDESDICGSAAWALEYLGENPVPVGDMSNLVIITDGESWYSSNSGTQQEREAAAAQNAAAMMTAYPDITVHTLCLGSWDETAWGVLSAGRGLHLAAASKAKAGEAGAEMAEYSDNLYRSSFSMVGYGDEAYIMDNLMFCVGNSLNTVGTVRNIAVAAPAASAVIPMDPVVPEGTVPPVQTTDPTEESPDPAEESTDPTQETADPTVPVEEPTSETEPQETAAEEETIEVTISETEGTEPAAGEDEPEDPGKPGWMIPAIIGVAAVAVLAAVLLVLKKTRAPAGSVRMSVEVLSGRVVKLKNLYYLSDQILIGTDRNCHIVIDDPGAAPVNTRIFKQGQMIYIEDMDSPGGTYLGGMRLYSSNRLRSGDDIAIGTVTLRILF